MMEYNTINYRDHIFILHVSASPSLSYAHPRPYLRKGAATTSLYARCVLGPPLSSRMESMITSIHDGRHGFRHRLRLLLYVVRLVVWSCTTPPGGMARTPHKGTS
jgi:hypothetical protein